MSYILWKLDYNKQKIRKTFKDQLSRAAGWPHCPHLSRCRDNSSRLSLSRRRSWGPPPEPSWVVYCERDSQSGKKVGKIPPLAGQEGNNALESKGHKTDQLINIVKCLGELKDLFVIAHIWSKTSLSFLFSPLCIPVFPTLLKVLKNNEVAEIQCTVYESKLQCHLRINFTSAMLYIALYLFSRDVETILDCKRQ